MARGDKTSALELHIKVNGQNLSAFSEKCTIGTLRPPSDPSWPKIPLRRLTDNIDDIIEHPCIVTLTGTPRKGRNIRRTTVCQHIKPRLSQNYETSTHVPKRLPGCTDPRFKKQILRQEAEKPDESCSMKNGIQTSELDTHILQETKKLKSNLRGRDERTDDHTSLLYHDVDKLLDNATKSIKETIDRSNKEQPILEANHFITASQYATYERHDVEDRFLQEQKQEANRSLVLMLDEKQIHAPINTLNIEAASSKAQPLQCYNVQIPVVTYHNVPLQIPNISMQIQEDVRIPYECQSASMKGRETIGNICAISTLTNSMHCLKESGDEKCLLNNIQQHNVKNNDILVNKNISYCDRHTSDWIRDKENINSNVSLNRDTINEISLNKSHHGNFSTIDNAKDGHSFSILNTAVRLKNITGQGSNTSVVDDYIADKCIERKISSERRIAENSVRPCTNMRKRRLACHVKSGRVNMNKSAISMMNNKVLQKYSQDLAFNKVRGEECSKSNNENKEKHGEQCVSLKRKMTPINLSKKAKSFFRKKSRLVVTDSDCTLILPGPRRIKGKQYEKTCSHLKKQNRPDSHSLTNLQVGNLFEKPSSIPLETQELLNKSYWEYYKKLRRKIASTNDKTDNAGKRDKRPNELRLPESQTLQQCSVLSCMINTALQNSVNADGKSSTDPVANVNMYEASGLSSVFAKKIKRKKMKRANKWFLGLKTIALLGIIMYIAIIFLPMMYDYFFAEKYDDYENASYIELTLQYIASSFEEAFDGIVEVLNIVFLRPVRFDRKL